MSVSITSPHNLRDTKLRDYLAEMREADRIAPSGDEDEPDGNRHVCLTCRRFTAIGRYDRMTLNALHLRSDDICAVMEGAGICTGDDDDDDRTPSLVLAEDDTCGEWEGHGTCDTSASSVG